MTPTTTTSMVVVGGVLAFFLMVQLVVGVPPYTYDGYASDDFPLEGPSDAADRGELTLDPYLSMNKRSCIRRGGRCDHRKDDCCSGGACRCNLWGTNCQCQRMGIFQKWG
ncbi:uncharacterized protein LOC110858247 isoform X2 [Folsomia candida]|uniref:uncharacterized protein LOC110858247 isoform X2 n=1 Tax=Folsomia candida TaxID=158441 RepID=UPI000B8F9FE2|nr:uncharacterized protein LOC110858247 isoform X2 [Folsomia candida]